MYALGLQMSTKEREKTALDGLTYEMPFEADGGAREGKITLSGEAFGKYHGHTGGLHVFS